MNLGIGLSVGIREIFAHKFRSFLTMLGIILGVSSLMAMFALTEGIARGMKETLYMIGGLEQVNIVNKEVSERNLSLADLSPGRTFDDAKAISLASPLVSHVSAVKNHGGRIMLGQHSDRKRFYGVTPGFLQVDAHAIEYGRFISDLDVERALRVVVLGELMVQKLWPDETDFNPVGQTVFLEHHPYKVIGKFEFYEREEDKRRRESGETEARAKRREERSGRTGRIPFQRKNEVVAIPITTLIHDFKSATVAEDGVDYGPDYKLDDFEVRIRDINYFNEALLQLENILNVTHRGIDDFGFETREDWFDNMQSSVRATKLSGMLIAGIALLVGGIGITNIMLASITERVREIGVRRAVGAKEKDIFFQILVESVVLGIIGGLIGLFAGFLLIQSLVMLAPTENSPVVTSTSIIISLCFAGGVGIISGIYPAWKAAKLDPIRALRYE